MLSSLKETKYCSFHSHTDTRACAPNLCFYHKHSQTDTNRSDKVKGAESQGGVGAPKFPKLLEGPDQRMPTKLMA